ncbi:MAG: ferric reductase-like transmembrane domain-containing protein [archaeon]|nr:ferric reductase-like transmembrane domain-containing protein [archaeon]
MKKRAYILSALVILAFAWYYLIFSARPLSLSFLNAIVAFSATVIIGLSALMGPIARFVPKWKNILEMRRPLGIIGFGLAALHLMMVVPILLENPSEVFLGDVVSIVVAGIAFVIFTLMALTSTSKWLEKLGYENWKMLQRLGYLAMTMVLFHIILLEEGVFLGRLTGQIAIIFVLAVILLRAIAFIAKKPETKTPINKLVLEH